MKQIIRDHLETLFDLTTDFANMLEEEKYSSKLGKLPSNTVGEQLSCIIGARESQLRVLKTGEPFHYDCSIGNPSNKLQVMQTLFHSAANILTWVDMNPVNDQQTKILLELIEHEAQHHGQLIRYVYGNKWQFPASWNKHYTV